MTAPIHLTWLGGPERDDETILFWHRGPGATDIALGHARLEKAARRGLGQRLRFA